MHLMRSRPRRLHRLPMVDSVKITYIFLIVKGFLCFLSLSLYDGGRGVVVANDGGAPPPPLVVVGTRA